MKYGTINFSDITKHPTMVMSAKYHLNIKAGKLPFTKNADGVYECSHTKKLNEAIYLTEKEAKGLNIALKELEKAQELVNKLLADK